MMRSLWTGASGMSGQQFNIDTIANNLSNVNTTGFKRNRADFQDLIYQTKRIAGTPATEETLVPVGTQVGSGVKVAGTQKIFTQGSLENTGNAGDLGIVGEGFFRVMRYDGSYAYTRDGAFKIDAEGQLVTDDGYRVMPEIVLPEGFLHESLNVTKDGRVFVELPGIDDPVEVGQMELYRFTNPAGLQAIGDNLFIDNAASGDPIAAQPGFDGMGHLEHKFIETSNVDVVQEMVDMIVAQRAYEMNSKTIQTSDAMLGIAANLKR